jgi:hypothetical protein
VRDQIVDFVRRWSEKTDIGAGRFVEWLGVKAGTFYDWRERYGKANEHNAWVPRDFWLEDWEKKAVIDFHLKNPLVLLLIAAASSYSPRWIACAQRPSFEVASVKPGESGSLRFGVGVHRTEFFATNAPLKILISFAYDVQYHQIVGGP